MMKRVILFACLSAGLLAAQEKTESTYGKGVTLKETTAISDVLGNPSSWVGKTVLVEGTVTEVCPMAGCWMDVADGGHSIRIKVKDGEIVFPKEAKGKTARAEGIVEALNMTREQAIAYYEHIAEETDTPFDQSKVTGPVTIYRIKGTGAVIR